MSLVRSTADMLAAGAATYVAQSLLKACKETSRIARER